MAWSTNPKPSNLFATVDDVGEEPSAARREESLSSRTSGDESAMDIDLTLASDSAEQAKVNSEAKATSPETQTTPKPAAPPAPPRPNEAQADTHDPTLNLGDLKNVAPFAPNQQGLKDLHDLSTALPFESRAAAQVTDESVPAPLVLPNLPKAPPIPEPLTQTAWERYLAQMRAYMFEWNAYNAKMLAHFNERQAMVENSLQPDWMSAAGDASGYSAYMQGLKEDFRVRAHWDVSWEKHRECMLGLGKVRERMRRLGVC